MLLEGGDSGGATVIGVHSAGGGGGSTVDDVRALPPRDHKLKADRGRSPVYHQELVVVARTAHQPVGRRHPRRACPLRPSSSTAVFARPPLSELPGCGALPLFRLAPSVRLDVVPARRLSGLLVPRLRRPILPRPDPPRGSPLPRRRERLGLAVPRRAAPDAVRLPRVGDRRPELVAACHEPVVVRGDREQVARDEFGGGQPVSSPLDFKSCRVGLGS